MSKEILKTNNTGLFGKKLNLPYAGETQISENGEIEVETKVAELLITKYDGSFSRLGDIEVVEEEEVKEPKKPKTEPKTEPKKEADKKLDVPVVPAAEVKENEEEEEEEDDLEALSLEELIELAKEAGFKEPTYRKFKTNKKLMIKFLNDRA